MIDVRPIRTEADYEWALGEVEAYFDNEPEIGSAAADRFDILSELIEAYEAKHWSIEGADPVEAIRHRMQTGRFNQSDLADLLGSRSRASEILNRKRPLTIGMVYKLATDWKIPAEILVAPYHTDSPPEPFSDAPVKRGSG